MSEQSHNADDERIETEHPLLKEPLLDLFDGHPPRRPGTKFED
jgi:hypothetical protein